MGWLLETFDDLVTIVAILLAALFIANLFLSGVFNFGAIISFIFSWKFLVGSALACVLLIGFYYSIMIVYGNGEQL